MSSTDNTLPRYDGTKQAAGVETGQSAEQITAFCIFEAANCAQIDPLAAMVSKKPDRWGGGGSALIPLASR